jgi:hypothetical protein
MRFFVTGLKPGENERNYSLCVAAGNPSTSPFFSVFFWDEERRLFTHFITDRTLPTTAIAMKA